MSITSDRVVNRLIKTLTDKKRVRYSHEKLLACMDAAAIVLIKIQKERHFGDKQP